MLLSSLPPELYAAILDHIDDDHIQSSVLALTRAVPHAPVPLDRLFESIRLCTPQSVIHLQRRLRGGQPEALYVRSLRIQSWTADAQVIINLLAQLDNLIALALFVGPNFAPENLLEIFEKPRERLESLSLRFRPYVQRANYYQFLKGAYFDPTISAIASWPSSSLHSLSVVQDPSTHQVSFAQPLVFFNFKPLLTLSISPAAHNITSLCIRIPGRDVGPYLAVAPKSFPALKVLDLSTGNIKGAQFDRLLARFDCVQHVRLDSCALLAGREPAEWAALGKDCALTGARRARDRERGLRAWKEAQEQRIHPSHERDAAQNRASKARAGRKGLATATLSLRGASEPTLPTPESSMSTSDIPPVDSLVLQRKIRVAPLPPSLLTLTATAPPPLPPDHPPEEHHDTTLVLRDHYATFRKAFAEGWESGIAQLRSTWTRLRSFARNNNTHVMVLTPGAPPEGSALDGLEEVNEECWKRLETGSYPPPILCFAGEVKGAGTLHPAGCGHQITEMMWGHPEFLGVK
ncbi:hypothetical protein ACEPAF_4249 [Sanghuangporus sanghuang]